MILFDKKTNIFATFEDLLKTLYRKYPPTHKRVKRITPKNTSPML
jgi:hypothetical protein